MNGLDFTGHVMDSQTRLIYMQARYYDPVQGRFLTPDPVEASTGSFNRYWYANNNPYTNIDPDGRESGAAFRLVNNLTNGSPVMPPPRSQKDWLGPAIGVSLTTMMAPVAAVAGVELTLAALANPATANSIAVGLMEVGAGEALGGSSLAVGVVLAGKQAANLARFERSLPAGNTVVAVDNLAEGVVFTSSVPGKIPGSQAVYQKIVDGAGDTAGLLKTIVDPQGSVVHIKDKIANAELPKY